MAGKIAIDSFAKSFAPFSVGDANAAAGTIGSSGYTKLPNGFIEQWTTIQLADSLGEINFIFPVAFPNACMGIHMQNLTYAAKQEISSSARAIGQVYSVSKSNAMLASTNTNVSGRLTWFFVRAIGY